MNTATHDVPIDETYRLISSDKVEGTTVENPEGDDLGDIKTIMIDKRSGKVAFAVLSFGGFLGLGKRYHPLPWSVLTYNVDRDAYVVNLDKETLKKGPSYESIDSPELLDRKYGQQVYDYYNVPPLWSL